jgi:Cu+-exporting ATPase
MFMSLHQPIDDAIHSLLDALNILQPTNHPWGWLAIALTVPVLFIAGWPIHRVGLRSFRRANMDTLISIGTLGAFFWSCYAQATATGEIYVEVAAGVMLFILFGRYLEGRSKIRAGAALRALLSLGAKEVSILRNGEEVLAPIDHLLVGDLFLVRPGDLIAAHQVHKLSGQQLTGMAGWSCARSELAHRVSSHGSLEWLCRHRARKLLSRDLLIASRQSSFPRLSLYPCLLSQFGFS